MKDILSLGKRFFSPFTLIRLILGGILIFSGIAKTLDPTGLVGIFDTYHFLPSSYTGILGTVVPWLEIITGLWLVLGLAPKLASWASLFLTTGFAASNIYAIFFNGISWNSQCGCFGETVPLSHAGSIALNFVMLAAALVLIVRYSKLPAFSLRPRIDYQSIRFALTLMFVFMVIAVPISLTFENASAASPVQTTDVAGTSLVNSNQYSSLDEQIRSSLVDGRPVFLYFYDPECHICQQQKPVVAGLESKYGDSITFLTLESQADLQAMDDFGLTGVPAMVLIYNTDAGGKYEYQKFLGATEATVLEASFEFGLSQMAAVLPDSNNSQTRIQSVSLSSANNLEQAWRQVQSQGTYRFSAEINETLTPRPVPDMIGQTSQKASVKLEGDISLPDKAQMTLSSDGPGQQIPTLKVIQDGGQTFIEANGKLEPYTNQVATSTPVNNFMGYLAAAENVRSLGSEMVSGEQLTRYSFDVDGNRLNDYLKEQSGSTTGSAGSTAITPVLTAMSGHGEVQVDSRGLPRKQILDLEMPGSTAYYDTSSHVEVKFYDFGAVKSLALPVLNSTDGTWSLQDTAITAMPAASATDLKPFAVKSLRAVWPWLLVILVIFFLYISLVGLGRTHGLERALITVTTLVVVATPTLSMTANDHETKMNQQEQASALTQENIAYTKANPPEVVEKAAQPAVFNQAGAVASSTHSGAQCGDGEVGVDTDNDGLDDRTEYCLGTNPFNADSDMDGIPDGQEAAGFDFTDSQGKTTHWPSDPLRADSNMDGMLDTYEWPESGGGTAPDWDMDNDGIPNLWDSDNDNDGVPDNIDLSPFSKTDYQTTIDFTSENPNAGDTYEYIDIQVQPAANHLQYGSAVFNWPEDDKGNIQDLDSSTDDIRLIPLLTIKTNVAPEKDLATNYGVSIFDNQAKDSGYPYLIYAPLSPVKSGDEISAYQARVAYDPARQSDIRWKVEMIWMVDAKLDQAVGNNIVVNHEPVQTYPEDNLRLTGLQVVKSGKYESAILGTPATPGDDKDLFNLLFGLSAGFLNSIQLEEQDPNNSELQEIKTRFEGANTAPELLWGVKTKVAVDLADYSHEDAAIAGLTQSRSNDFLNANYAGAPNASLVFANEYTSGSLNLDSLTAGGPLHFNLSSISMTTERGVKLQMYGRQGNTWSGLSLAGMLDVIKTRYADTSPMLAELRQTYPDLTTQDIFTVLALFYTTWGSEQRVLMDVDGLKLVSDVTGDQKIYSFLSRTASLPEYLISVGSLAKPGGGLLIGQDISANWDYVRATEDNNLFTQIKTALGPEFKPIISFGSYIAGSLIPWDKEVNETLGTIAVGIGRLQRTLSTVKQTYTLIKDITNSTIRSLDHVKQIAKSWTSLGKGDAAMMVLSVGMTWASFALFTDFDNPVSLGNAISEAVVETVVTVALTVLACNPVGAIIGAVLAIVDVIVYIATLGEFSFMSTAIEYTAKFFYRSEMLTQLDSGSFSGSDTDIQKYGAPEDGLLVGNRFEVSDKFVGVIKKTGEGNTTDLYNSGAYGEYLGGVTNSGDASFANNNKNANYGHCVVNSSAGITTCKNDTGIIFEFLTAKPNVALTITGDVKSKVRYENCVLWAFCWRKDMYKTYPDDLTPTTIYLDVLPATVEDFWNWDLFKTTSTQEGNSALESTEQSIWQKDSDGDGLSDGQENMIGTFPDKWDSDGDGLSDGQEFYHQDPLSGEWQGGWEIKLLNDNTTRVFSDPLMKDTDYDGLTDNIEQAGALSPNAYNSGPRLTLLAAPLYSNSSGSTGVYIEPGDDVNFTLKLFNGGADPISSKLDLCLPSAFISYTGGQLAGDETPDSQLTKPSQCGSDANGTRLAWDFGGGNNLQPLESVSATLTLHSNAALTQTSHPDILGALSAAGAITIPITQSIPVTIDVDSPTAAFTSGELIGGGITGYVLGGTASDPGSWVKGVQLTLPEGTVTAAGTEVWAYTWAMPADGVYTLSAQATDFFGHAGPQAYKKVTVDNTPPEATVTSPAEGTAVSSDAENMIDIALAGTATDNLSGVSRVQISINERPWQGVTMAGPRWTYNWVIPGTESAQGQHNVRVRALDKAGNLGQPVERTIVVDVVQPTSELTDKTFTVSVPSVPTNQEMTISGVANDAGNVPEPARPAEMAGNLNSVNDATIWFEPSSIKDNEGGVNVQWLGDFNGDGLADLAIGLPGAAHGAGRISIIYGVSGGWTVPPDGEALADTPASFIGAAGAGIGTGVAPVGDVNGDGFDDMLVADTANNRAHLVFGGRNAPGTDLLLGDSPRAGLTTLLSLPVGYTLQEVGPAGDVNGDGLDDLFITTGGDANKTFLILGQSLWLSQIDIEAQAAAVVERPAVNALVRKAGDLNNDGLADFVMSVPGQDVYLFYGNASLTGQGHTASTVSDGQPLDPDTQFSDSTLIAASSGSEGTDELFINKGESVYRCSGNADGSLACAAVINSINNLSFITAVGNVHDISNEGLNDLLIGSGTDALLYVGAGVGVKYAATFTGVQSAAPAPYNAAADFNIDGSADLLLVPDISTTSIQGDQSFGQVPAVNQNALPSINASDGRSASFNFSSVALPAVEDVHTLYVANDGLCDDSTTCYSNIQEAVDAAVSGDIIEVRPGVYAGFTVVTGNLTIVGLDPDAVFVDGGSSSDAVTISGAAGISLIDMTLRNAANAVRLENAGVGGYEDADKMITLERLFIYNSGHALWMDRVSTAVVKHCTIVGLTDSSYIQVGAVPDPVLSPAWTSLETITGTPANSEGGKLLADSDGTLYAVQGGDSKSISQLQPGMESWGPYTEAPVPVKAASAAAIDNSDNLWLLAHDELFDADFHKMTGGASGTKLIADTAVISPNDIYIVGAVDKIGSIVLNPPGIAHWNGTAWESLGLGSATSNPPASENTVSGFFSIAYIGGSTLAGGWDIAVGAYGGVYLYDNETGDWKTLPGFGLHSYHYGPYVYTLAINSDGTRLYAGGTFFSSSGYANGPGNGVAYWDFRDNAWHKLGYDDAQSNGTFTPSEVWDIAVDGKHIYLGGMFSGGVFGPSTMIPSPNVIMFDESVWDVSGCPSGSCWKPLAKGVSGTVHALSVYRDFNSQPAPNPLLILGGSDISIIFSQMRNAPIQGYDLAQQQFVDLNLGGVLDGQVSSLAASGGYMYIGGSFNEAVGTGMTSANLSYIDCSTFRCIFGNVAGYGTNGAVTALDAATNEYGQPTIYAAGDFTRTGSTISNHIGAYSNTQTWEAYWMGRSLFSYDGTWISHSGAPVSVKEGAVLVSDPENSLYAISGSDNQIYRYSGGNWTAAADLAAAPGVIGVGAVAVWANDSLFLLRGDQTKDFYCYKAGTNTWTALAPTPYGIDSGAGLAWDGEGHLYAVPGGGGPYFMRYNINGDSWQVLSNVPGNIRSGGGLAGTGNELFAIRGGGLSGFWKYGLLNQHPEKLKLENSVFAAPSGSSSVVWLNLDPSAPPEDFDIVADNTSIWASGANTAWLPRPGGTPLTLEEAAFLAPSKDVYRLTAETPFTAGYRQYEPDAVVSTSGCDGCYTSIQAAIDSGANRVVVQSGNYTEDIDLVSGLTLSGAGAGSTVINGINAPAVILAEGVQGASVSGFTLTADDSRNGLSVTQGARYIEFSRSIVRNTATAVAVEGDKSDLEIFNNTIVNNINGIMATSKAPVDVRNTILAFNSGAGLEYDSAAAVKLHNYNLYWSNGSDISPDEVGAGELFLDPLFTDRLANDYRTAQSSPVADAGDPGDPAPPGTGTRVDIGYLEQGRASFYADDDYCAGCINDGLTWGVDAFDSIQGALDAASAAQQLLKDALDGPGFTVGVSAGTYPENISIPSYINLVGSGADRSLITGAGGNTEAVTFNGTVQAGISNFNIGGGSGSPLARGIHVTGFANHVEISRNLLHNCDIDILFDGGATGQVLSNTLVEGSPVHLESRGERTWVEVRDSILAGGQTGLSTADGGRIYSSYNLLWNDNNYADGADTGLGQTETDIIESPDFAAGGLYHLSAGSPAVDTADPDETVPLGGGTRADVGCFELTSSPISLFLGDENISLAVANSGVAKVEYGIVKVDDPTQATGDTLPQVWTSVPASDIKNVVGNTVRSWSATYTPTQDGLYRIYARAYDLVSNVETDPAVWYNGSFTADGSVPTVNWLSTQDSINSPLELRAEVEDYVAGSFNVDDVYFEVNGSRVEAQWATDGWQAATGDPRVFRAWLPVEDNARVQAFAVDRAGHQGESTLRVLNVLGQNPADVTPPVLAIARPERGAVVKSTVEISGTSFDNESGLAGVEVSLDGGITWQGAGWSDNTTWIFNWETPDDQEFVTFPVRIRADDNAGNTAELTLELTVDNQPPGGIVPIEFSAAPGRHLAVGDNLTISWQKPVDGSGQAEAMAAVDTTEETEPTTVQNGDNLTYTFDAAGRWYVHVAAQDPTGNKTVYHNGPWFVGDPLNAICSLRQRSTIIDGTVDVEGGEWSDQTQRLGDDERPPRQQVFYAAWDAASFYLAWTGAHWQIDGTLWSYLGDNTPGTSSTVNGAATLPFEASYAVEVQSPGAGILWKYNGTNWINGGVLDFAVEGDNTEVRLPVGTLDLTGQISLLAFATSENGKIWSIFPTTDSLDGNWTDYYHWDDLCAAAAVPNQGQPQSISLDLAVSSPQQSEAPLSPAASVTYNLNITNHEYRTLSGLKLTAGTTGGLTFQSQTGAQSCLSCDAGTSQWEMVLPDLDSAQSYTITLVGRLDTADNLTSTEKVTASFDIQLGDIQAAQGSYSHKVDAQPPTLEIFYKQSQSVSTGRGTISGGASDGAGSGVARVEWRPEGSSTWNTASGAGIWNFPVDVSDPGIGETFNIELRGIDYCGNMSTPLPASFEIDRTPPIVQFNTGNLPAVVTGNFLNIRGLTNDVSGVQNVEIRVDSNAWMNVVSIYNPNSITGDQNWLFTWDIPAEDSNTHQIEARATDIVGNQSAPVSINLKVDTAGPDIKGDLDHDNVNLWDYMGLPGRAGPAVLSGTVSDDSGLKNMWVNVITPDGLDLGAQSVTPDSSGNWTFTPLLSRIKGRYTLAIGAVDLLGNKIKENWRPKFYLDIANQPPLADAGGPYSVKEGTPIQLSAAGSTDPDYLKEEEIRLYEWDIDGDGEYDDAIGETAQALFDDNGAYTPAVRVTDIGGAWSTAVAQVNVENVAPTVNAGPDKTISYGASFSSSGSFRDPGADIWTATVDYGDGAGVSQLGLNPDKTFALSHNYASIGTHLVTITVTDDDGGVGVDKVAVTVVSNTSSTGQLEINLGGMVVSVEISIDGTVQHTINSTSPDQNISISIPAGTIIRNKNGAPSGSLSMSARTNPPAPPVDSYIVGPAYDFGPGGTTFSPPMTLVWNYDPADLPVGVNDVSLLVAFFNELTGSWTVLPSVVDLINHKITVSVGHFTTFAVMAHLIAIVPTTTPTPVNTPVATPTPAATPAFTVMPVPAPTASQSLTPAPESTVLEPVTPSPQSAVSPAPEEPKGTNSWVVIGPLIGVLLVGFFVYLIVKRRKGYSVK